MCTGRVCNIMTAAVYDVTLYEYRKPRKRCDEVHHFIDRYKYQLYAAVHNIWVQYCIYLWLRQQKKNTFIHVHAMCIRAYARKRQNIRGKLPLPLTFRIVWVANRRARLNKRMSKRILQRRGPECVYVCVVGCTLDVMTYIIIYACACIRAAVGGDPEWKSQRQRRRRWLPGFRCCSRRISYCRIRTGSGSAFIVLKNTKRSACVRRRACLLRILIFNQLSQTHVKMNVFDYKYEFMNVDDESLMCVYDVWVYTVCYCVLYVGHVFNNATVNTL